jgi:cyanophycin synthetase
VYAVVPRAVAPGGASVLNADDEWTVQMAAHVEGELIYFSLDQQSPIIAQHLRDGGRAVVLQQTPAGALLVLLAGEEDTALLLATEIPATEHGHNRGNIASALAATGAAIARQVPVETIRTALRSFVMERDENGQRVASSH